jgi:CheY-like chemotaxis protein
MTVVQKRVLVVDDDEEIRGLLTAVLERHDLTVDVAVDGAAAMELLRDTQYAVALIDLMMPNMDGWELIDTLREDPALARIPSAVVSAAQDKRGLPKSIVTFSKPCDLGEVIRFLRTACPDQHAPM